MVAAWRCHYNAPAGIRVGCVLSHMNDLRIGHLIESVSPRSGGPSQVVLYLTQAQCSLGARPAICCEDKPAEREGSHRLIEQICTEHEPQMVWLPPGPNVGSHSLGLAARRQLDRVLEPFDVLHLHGMWSAVGWHAARRAARMAKPYVLRPAGMLEPWSLKHKGWKKRLVLGPLYGRVFNAAGAIHVTGEKEARGMQYLPYDMPIALLPNGVAIPDAEPDPRQLLRDRWPELAEHRIALFIGRLHPVKGLDHLMPAWADVQARHPDWRLILAGPDQDGYQAQLEQKIAELGVSQSVRFVGSIWGREKNQLVQSADLLVAPSLQENFGVSIAEALAARMPAITTDQTPWRDLEDHQCGWFIPVGDEPLARALDEAMGMTADQRDQMGRRGRELVETKYAWPAIADKTLQLYRWLTGADPRPDFIVAD